jgi:2-polyprenyl-3-methyl-5-hydroxy-6-metoxy-1,4-benzoquinol methylase
VTQQWRFVERLPVGCENPFEKLRWKWGTIPSGNALRQDSTYLHTLSDAEVPSNGSMRELTTHRAPDFGIRGWYHEMYRSFMPGKQVLDIGCGMGISTISFAEMDTDLTFVDIAEDNLRLVERL